jgi:hypothetical protein
VIISQRKLRIFPKILWCMGIIQKRQKQQQKQRRKKMIIFLSFYDEK